MKHFFIKYILYLIVLFCSSFNFQFSINILQFQTAIAGEITLVVETTTSLTDSVSEINIGNSLHQVRSELKISNKGTDIAQNVLIEAKLLEEKKSVLVASQIKPSESKSASVEFSLPADKKGTFPILVTVLYEDMNGYSYSCTVLTLAHTATSPKSSLSLQALKDKYSERIYCQIVNISDPDIDITLTCHIPNELTTSQKINYLKLKNGKAFAEFDINHREGLLGSKYTIFITAEYEHAGIHYLNYTEILIPIEKKFPIRLSLSLRNKVLFIIALLILNLLIVYITIQMTRKILLKEKSQQHFILDMLTILIIEGFIFSQMSPQYLFTQTTTTGGDTASHYYTLEYLRHTLLPKGEIGGWTHGNYAGFPILQFYFPLPFLLMCALNIFIPLQIAFKWVTLLGTFLLPPAMYMMLKYIRCPFPGPAIGSVFSLPFLFNSTNSMWGGNLPSTLAGEFSYSLSLSISLIFLGSLYHGCMKNRYLIRNAILVFLIGFSHGYTLLFVEAVSLFFLITSDEFLKRLTYMFKMYALGFFFLAFWLIPLIAFIKDTTAYHFAWSFSSLNELIPNILLPVLIIAMISTIFIQRRIRTVHISLRTSLRFLWFCMFISIIMFIFATKLGVVDIRFVPYGQLMICIIAALGLGWLGNCLDKRRNISWIGLILISVGTIIWTSKYVEPVPSWSKWNYEGFEAKKDWPLYCKINDSIRGTFQDPRVIFEHSPIHNRFGTSRAFESLPLFAGRSTLEGLYMQASLSAPFIFYIQSEISKEKSCPFRQYTCTDMDFGRAKHHLEMFNVRELILISEEAKTAIRNYPEFYRLQQKIEKYEIWELISHEGHYVVPLKYEPILYVTNDWKTDAYRWFTTDEISDVHVVFVENLKTVSPFKIKTESLENIKRIPIDTNACWIKETIQDEEILIETNWINKPLLVKVSYHQNWKIEGADQIYSVSPAFMLIFPNHKKVRLYYAHGMPKKIGMALTGLGIVILLMNVPLPWKHKSTAWQLVARHIPMVL
ncbi:MAG: hypothetical protein HQK77_04095 [Desulfobacterales bacterium]|nr:hypothetical protein [Desulfobacterales bacterium]